MVLPDSHRVSRVPWYSGAVCAVFDFSYGAITPYGQVFQPVHLSNYGSRDDGPTTPHTPRAMWFGLVPVRSPLLRKSLLFLSWVTKMFQFTPFRPQQPMYSAEDVGALPPTVAPFRNLRIKACLTAPRSLSQFNHVFHRLLLPRYPPYALSSFILVFKNYGYSILKNIDTLFSSSIWSCYVIIKEIKKSFANFKVSILTLTGGRTWTWTRDPILIRDVL